MLEFISENSQLLGIVTVSLAGLFTFIKWIDTRNRELKEKRYDTYMNLVSVISGMRKNGQGAKLTEQIAAVWFLLEYDEYKNITKKIFSETNLETVGDDIWTGHIAPQIKLMLDETSK